MAIVVEVIEKTNEIEVVVSNGRGPQGPPGITEWGFGGDINNQTDLIAKFYQEKSDRVAGDNALGIRVDDKLDKNGLSGRFRTVDGKLIKIDEGGNASIENYIDGTYQDFNNRVVADGGTTDEVSSKEAICEATPEALSVISANGGSVGKIHDLVSNGFATVQRNSNATYIEYGIIKTAAPNVPRFQDGKILREGEATNLVGRRINSIYQAEDLGTDLVISPLGNVEEIGRFKGTGESSQYVRFGRPIQGDDGIPKAASIWVRSVTGTNFVGIQSEDRNLLYYTVGTEWTRIYTSSVGETKNYNSFLNVRLEDFDEVYLWQPQLEVTTDGIPTTTILTTESTIATRLADVITINPPTGTKKIITTIDGVEQSTTTIPTTYQLPEGDINKVEFLPEVCEDKGEPNINPDSDVKNLKFWKGTQSEFDAQAPFDDDVITFII